MAAATEPIPGMSDLWEPEVQDWLVLERVAREIFPRYGYGELRTPVLERTDVFVRSIGNETDVVQKEMYTFEDRGGRSLTLRPEGTAGVIRAIANRGLDQGEERRVFYMGPMFRGERPAAGRKRQFHQVGVEAVGSCHALTDAETIAMLVHYLEGIGIPNGRVLINTRGIAADRERVSTALRDHFSPMKAQLCPDCQRRLETNVWRILDCKAETCRALVESAPNMIDLIGADSRDFFQTVCNSLRDLGVEFDLAPRLVRGLDYYVHTVFEVTHTGLGAQDALAGGGRYAIDLPGSKKPIEGVGFAAGMERLLMARESLGQVHADQGEIDLAVVALGSNEASAALGIAQSLRRTLPGIRIRVDFTGRSMKAQLRTANRLGARHVCILGESELARGVVTMKNMETSEQRDIPYADIATIFRPAD